MFKMLLNDKTIDYTHKLYLHMCMPPYIRIYIYICLYIYIYMRDTYLISKQNKHKLEIMSEPRRCLATENLNCDSTIHKEIMDNHHRRHYPNEYERTTTHLHDR